MALQSIIGILINRRTPSTKPTSLNTFGIWKNADFRLGLDPNGPAVLIKNAELFIQACLLKSTKNAEAYIPSLATFH